MIYLTWLGFALFDWLLWLTVWPAALLISPFTRAQAYGQAPYRWGGWWGTYDNPPQGDQGFVAKRAWFPGETTGFKGWLNRINWMTRNPLYGLARQLSLPYAEGLRLEVRGNPDISDKYAIPGWYFARLYGGDGLLMGFEFYGVFPWSQTRDLRIRLGWKLVTDKYKQQGFAPLVNTFNPLDGYGGSA